GLEGPAAADEFGDDGIAAGEMFCGGVEGEGKRGGVVDHGGGPCASARQGSAKMLGAKEKRKECAKLALCNPPIYLPNSCNLARQRSLSLTAALGASSRSAYVLRLRPGTSPTEKRLISRVLLPRGAITGHFGPSQMVPIESPSNSMLG